MPRMIVTAEVRRRVEARIVECWNLAVEEYGDQLRNMPTWDFRKRGRVAGTAELRDNNMSFNSVLLMENTDDFIARTVGHEVAHIVDYQVNGITTKMHRRRLVHDQHGHRWARIMILFGQDPSRCHSYDTTNSRVQRTNNRVKHIWTCSCGREMSLGAKRHANVVHGTGMYWMRGCGNKHVYTYTHLERGDQRVPAEISVQRMTGNSMAASTYNAQQRQGTGYSERPRLAADAPRPDPTFRPQPRVRETGGSKLDKCRVLFRENYGVARKVMIRLFMQEAGCSQGGAATYYQKIKKELGA